MGILAIMIHPIFKLCAVAVIVSRLVTVEIGKLLDVKHMASLRRKL
jgi:hypothetical protein